MARGLPDDSNIIKQGAVYNLDDMAELAARLRSPVNFIRFGDVYMMETFDCGLGAWGDSIRGVGGYIQLTSTHLRDRGICVHINTGTGANPDSAIWRRLPVPDTGKMAFGFSFAYENALIDVQLRLLVTIAEELYRFYIKIVVATGTFYYWNHLGIWTQFDVTAIGGFQWLFHMCKLVVSIDTKNYVRFYFNNRVYDLSGIPSQQVANPGSADYCECNVRGTGVAMADGDLYLDDAVTTQNEI